MKVFCLVISCLTFSTFSYASTSEQYKKMVTSFYDLAFNQHQPEKAVQLFVGKEYIQHNPFVETGTQPFIDFFKGFHKQYPKSHAMIKRVLAEGNLVILHVHSKLDDQDLGHAVIDIFRIENNKIVEHWDVSQPIPEKPANSNGMF